MSCRAGCVLFYKSRPMRGNIATSEGFIGLTRGPT
jgi:hypothetical protein